ncbi:hypothetical protein PXH69_31525 [Rhodococcus qingshengii]|uniref:Secreted protein n=1 Tax=Rhodococcus qingshengii TaxID=334542 RepID=A0AAW6LYT8_RHOSG|nr:hypothetical protein [Rhodococcus qingshengii]MDE8649508.1 hypothetical protein [Rhodococcus qingshengii]
MKRRITVVTALLTLLPLLPACSTPATQRVATPNQSASTDGDRIGVVTPAESSLWPGNLAIGVGDIQSAQFITTPAPDQVQARCIGAGDNLTIGITAPNGWNALLTHGSQTIAIENKELDYPLQEFTTPQSALDSESESNNKFGTTDLFPPGVTWDLPQLGDVEIQLSQKTPPHWQIRARERVTIDMHVRCEGT